MCTQCHQRGALYDLLIATHGTGSATPTASGVPGPRGGAATSSAQANDVNSGKRERERFLDTIMMECMKDAGMMKRLGLEYSRGENGGTQNRSQNPGVRGKRGCSRSSTPQRMASS